MDKVKVIRPESEVDSLTVKKIGGPKKPSRLFRNNTGALYNNKGQLVKYGLFIGSSDRIGLTKIKITPDMVGREIGVFTALEMKHSHWNPPKSGKAKKHYDEQKDFIDIIKRFKGIAGFVTDPDDAIKLIKEFIDGK